VGRGKFFGLSAGPHDRREQRRAKSDRRFIQYGRKRSGKRGLIPANEEISTKKHEILIETSSKK
jgi:hypothetical protein